MNAGISLTQPPHLVAQRSRRRGLPLKLESETELPEASRNTKSGAGLRAACRSTATRISAASTSQHAARQIISVRIDFFHCTLPMLGKSDLQCMADALLVQGLAPNFRGAHAPEAATFRSEFSWDHIPALNGTRPSRCAMRSSDLTWR